MSNNEEQNIQTDGRLEESLIQLNKLSYQMAPQLGICSARTHTIGFPQQSTYANGETMTWDSQTGAFYVDPVGSYLKFTVTYTMTAEANMYEPSNNSNQVLSGLLSEQIKLQNINNMLQAKGNQLDASKNKRYINKMKVNKS